MALITARAPFPFDRAQAETFVTALTGSPSSTVVLQFADDTGAQRRELTRVHVGTIAQLADLIEKLNAAGAAVWMQINAGRRGIRNVTEIRACFVDDDGKSALPPLLRLPPSMIVASSSGQRNRHYYWLTAQGQSIDRWTLAQKRLIGVYQSDKSIHNLDRVMRLPGTWNHKRREPQAVQLLEVNPQRQYTLEEILAAHPSATSDPEYELAPLVEKVSEAQAASVQRIGFWLRTQAVPFDQPTPISFRLQTCVFDPSHEPNKLMIRVQTRGGVWAGCWHDHCGANINRWSEVKDRIGGWREGGPAFSRGDDVELARRLLTDLTADSEEAIVADLGRLWKYDHSRGLWDPVDDATQVQTISSYAGAPINGGKKRLAISRGAINGAMYVAQGMALHQNYFEDAAPGIAFENGFLAATPAGAAFAPHGPENRQTVGLPFAYSHDAACPLWCNYLATCFEGDEDAALKIDALQEFLGACLVGLATRYQKALLLLGEQGDNGKSVFTYVTSHLFPANTRAAINPQMWGQEYYRAKLAGIRLNAVSEMPETDILASDHFKAMITGDMIGGREPTKMPFDYHPIAGHIFAANRAPGTSDHSGGFWKRFLIIVWNRSFPLGHPLRDDTLKDRIVSAEMAGIAAWAVQGATRLLARGGFTIPPSHDAAMMLWRREVDPVLWWLTESTEPANILIGATELYQDFRAWCSNNGHKTLSHATFGRRLRGHRVDTHRTSKGMEYGLKLIKRNSALAGYLID